LQIGEHQYDQEGVAIVPRLNFTCNGIITTIRARILRDKSGTDVYPRIQIWRPSLSNSMTYDKIGEIQVQETQVKLVENIGLRVANIFLTANDTILVQSGDVVGFYHQFNSRNQVRTSTSPVDGYVLYFFDGSNAAMSLNLNDVDMIYSGRQPLIQFTVGNVTVLIMCTNENLDVIYLQCTSNISDIQCYTPSNGVITSCSSGVVEVVNENDICNFTCNTGYELTGSDTRTCQSDGSWSGRETICAKSGQFVLSHTLIIL